MSFFKSKPKIIAEEGTAICIDEVGAIKIRVFKIIKKIEDKTTIDFGNNETYTINSKMIRAKRIILYKKSDGKILIQDPNKWKDIDLNKFGIKELRFNLQNIGIQEGKAAIHRWTLPPDTITKLAPLFKLLMICIAVGLIGWSALKFGTYVLDVVMQSRLLDCNAVLPKAPVPIGAIVNQTIANVTV